MVAASEGAALTVEARLLEDIDTWLASAGACGKAEVESRVPHPALDLESALGTQSWLSLQPETVAILDRLRKKIEVARKLCRYYLPDLSRPAAPTPLSAAGVNCLCGLLLKAALRECDARYLNSALKLLDGVLGRADCSFPDELRLLARSTLDVLAPPTPFAA